MIYLNRFYLPEEKKYDGRESFYPFNVFCDKNLQEIRFDNITIFYGSNGSGKSTLINFIIKELNKKQEVIKASLDSKSDIKRKYKLIIEEEYISESDSPHDIEKIINSYCNYT